AFWGAFRLPRKSTYNKVSLILALFLCCPLHSIRQIYLPMYNSYYPSRTRSMPTQSFSVLMSVYSKERASYLQQALNSLSAQTLRPSQIVIVEDGPLDNDLRRVIEQYTALLPLTLVQLDTNVGLARALNAGLLKCEHEIIVRMDSDDQALPERFYRQLQFLEQHPEIDVVGSWIIETSEDITVDVTLKRLPCEHTNIVAFSKWRNPIAHPAVAFRRDAVKKAGMYPLIFPEDYALWSTMIVQGYRFANIPEVLLRMRTGNSFLNRRGIDFL